MASFAAFIPINGCEDWIAIKPATVDIGVTGGAFGGGGNELYECVLSFMAGVACNRAMSAGEWKGGFIVMGDVEITGQEMCGGVASETVRAAGQIRELTAMGIGMALLTGVG